MFISASVFAIWKEVAFTDWADFMVWLGGIYAVGNVGEHGADALSKRNNNQNN
jgi:hypothetical protein